MTGFGSPCGACKFLRRKCVRGCVFAPYFCHEQGAGHFAAIHKVFGASNASKLLEHLPLADRPEAAVTISYEAQARLRDPIYGCVAHIFALQQQVMTLQAQLASLKAQAAQGQAMQEDAKGGYMSSVEQLGYGYPWCSSNGGGLVGAQAAQPCAYSNGGHESMSALLAGSEDSDYMQQSLYHAFEQAAVDDGQAEAAAAFDAAESSSFGAEESGWRSSSGYQDCEDLQSVAFAYLNRS
uniref:Crown rootless protein n=1 Tax=Dendrocalamus brandisii TaxID=280849 RepID=A0A9E8DAR3_9POAL|nr:crown rootless protein [Dendrocalamus brandisii]